MSNVKIILDNIADRAALSGVPAVVPSLPVTMMQDRRRGRAMRSVGTSQVILGNHSGVQTADGCALIRHNLTDLAIIRIKLYADENQAGALVYDSGERAYGDLIPAGEFNPGVDPFGGAYHSPSMAIIWFESVGYRSFEISLNDATNDDGYLQIERLMMGLAFQPENNFSWGSDLEFVDTSDRARTASGGLRTRDQSGFRRLTLSLDWVTEADRSRLSSALRKAGNNDLLVSAYPDETGLRLSDYSLIAQVVGGVKFTHNRVNNYRLPLVFEEV